MVNEVSNCIKQTLKKYMNTPKKDGGQRIDKSIRHLHQAKSSKKKEKITGVLCFNNLKVFEY